MAQPDWLKKDGLTVGGIHVNVFRDGTSSGKNPVGVFFFLHGRLRNASTLDGASRKLLEIVHNTLESERVRDLFVITLDHRNHGAREVELARNSGWRDPQFLSDGSTIPKSGEEIDNVRHASDMYSIQLGSTYDVSFLIDFLPSALFPNDERVIDKWMLGGVSLGGHSAWMGLGLDSRISLGIPIVGSPDFITLLEDRAKSSKPPIPTGPPIFPESLRALVRLKDPVNQPFSVWVGKDILVLSGETDNLVSFEAGGGRAFANLLLQSQSDKPRTLDIWVQPQTGHKMTPEMVVRAGQFILQHGLQS